MSSAIRPLRLGEILDQTAQLYRRNFLLFAGTAVIPNAVIFGAYFVIFTIAGVPMLMRSAKTPPDFVFGGLFFLLMLIAMPLFLVSMVFAHAGVTRAAVNAFHGERMKVREALASVKPRFWRYLGLMLLQGLLIIGVPSFIAGILGVALVLMARAGGSLTYLAGFLGVCLVLAMIVAIIVLVTEFGMGIAACVVEDAPATEALGRARKLSKGTRGRIFVMLLVVWGISIVLSVIGYIPMIILGGLIAAIGHSSVSSNLMFVAMEIINILMNFCLQTLVVPAYLVALVMFYFDQRVRLEGYDIEWMMQQAGLTPPVPEVTTNTIAQVSTAEASPAPAQEQ
jgi:hypothetical protein